MARITLRDYRHALGDLLDAVLVQDPVAESPQYLTSAFLQIRRALLDQDTVDINASLESPRLPDWLNGHVPLGPYERSLLQRILANSHRGVIVVRGGSGSGKSSTLKHIVRQCAAAAKKMPWANRYGFRTFIHRIDLQATCETARSMVPETASSAPVDVWHILRGSISNLIDSILTDHLRDDAAFVQLVKDAASSSTSENYTDLEGSQAPLRRILEDAGPTPTRSRIMALLGTLPLSDALLVRLLLLAQLARVLRDEDGRQLLVVIDNVDPLPAILQKVVVSILASLVPARLWEPLCLIILARLSTAQHSLGALYPFMIEHSSPDASDVVLYRLTWFFLFPDTFTTFKNASDYVRQPIAMRLFELWRHLLDPAGYVRRMLSAMAGTNLRNGLEFAKTWCLSERFDTSRAFVKDLRRGVSELYAFQVLSELDSSLGRAVDALFDSDEAAVFARAVDADGAELAAAEWAKRFVRATTNVLRDLHFVCPADDDQNQLRHRVCVSGREPIYNILQDDAALQRATALLHLACSQGFQRMVTAVVEQLMRNGNDEEVARNIAADALQAFVGHLRRALHVFSTTDTVQRNGAELLVSWVVNTIDLARATPISRAAVQRRILLGDSALSDVARLQMGGFVVAPSTSRFDAASILVDPGVADRGTPANALNVFAIDEARVCPAALRVIYLLAKSKYGQLNVGELFDDLRLHKFYYGEIRAAFRQMARTEKRLLFAGLSDSNDDIDRWLKRDTVVFLSSAGRRYYEDLLSAPAYLQWAFNDISEIRREQRKDGLDIRVDGPLSLADRVHAALIGFDVVVRQETERFRRAWQSHGRSGGIGRHRGLVRAAEMTFQSAAADLFYRSYASFIHSLLSNVRRLRTEGSPKALSRARDVTLLLESSGRRWASEYAEFFGGPNTSWSVLMDEAQRDVDEICNRF